MTSHTSAFSEEALRGPQDFSLVLGGPLFQFLRRSHLSGDALELARRCLITIPLLAIGYTVLRSWLDQAASAAVE